MSHKTEMDLHSICEMKTKLVSWMQEEMMNGKQTFNVQEAGQVIDMIKDLAEAEEKCWKACYYKKKAQGMDESHEMSKRMGYDNWRSSDGRFADKGTGSYYGFTPTHWAMEPWQNPSNGMRMGYSSPEHMAQSVRDMWNSADPKTKERLKEDMTHLVEEMD